MTKSLVGNVYLVGPGPASQAHHFEGQRISSLKM